MSGTLLILLEAVGGEAEGGQWASMAFMTCTVKMVGLIVCYMSEAEVNKQRVAQGVACCFYDTQYTC